MIWLPLISSTNLLLCDLLPALQAMMPYESPKGDMLDDVCRFIPYELLDSREITNIQLLLNFVICDYDASLIERYPSSRHQEPESCNHRVDQAKYKLFIAEQITQSSRFRHPSTSASGRASRSLTRHQSPQLLHREKITNRHARYTIIIILASRANPTRPEHHHDLALHRDNFSK